MRAILSLLLVLILVVACLDTTLFQPAEESADTPVALVRPGNIELEAEVEPLYSGSSSASVSPALISVAGELVADPFLQQLVNSLTIPQDVKRIQRAFDHLSAALVSGDAKAQRDALEGAKDAVAESGVLGSDADDDIHLDAIDRFLDAIEEMMLAEEDINKPKGRS